MTASSAFFIASQTETFDHKTLFVWKRSHRFSLNCSDDSALIGIGLFEASAQQLQAVASQAFTMKTAGRTPLMEHQDDINYTCVLQWTRRLGSVARRPKETSAGVGTRPVTCQQVNVAERQLTGSPATSATAFSLPKESLRPKVLLLLQNIHKCSIRLAVEDVIWRHRFGKDQLLVAFSFIYLRLAH